MSKKVEIYVRSRKTDSTVWSSKNGSLSFMIDKKETNLDGFNNIFIEESNKEIFDEIIKSHLNDFIKKGENITIFAYGQTGSGKTFTMTGDIESGNRGIIQYSLELLKYPDCKMSYFEIYNDFSVRSKKFLLIGIWKNYRY